MLWVTLDFIANDTTDTGLLRAFNSVGTLLETRLTAPLAQNQIEHAHGRKWEANIAYVLAGGNAVTTTYDAILLDNSALRHPRALHPRLFGTSHTGLRLATAGAGGVRRVPTVYTRTAGGSFPSCSQSGRMSR